MFDSVIIGSGVAGCVAARELAEAGRKVLSWNSGIISVEIVMMKKMSMGF